MGQTKTMLLLGPEKFLVYMYQDIYTSGHKTVFSLGVIISKELSSKGFDLSLIEVQ